MEHGSSVLLPVRYEKKGSSFSQEQNSGRLHHTPKMRTKRPTTQHQRHLLHPPPDQPPPTAGGSCNSTSQYRCQFICIQKKIKEMQPKSQIENTEQRSCKKIHLLGVVGTSAILHMCARVMTILRSSSERLIREVWWRLTLLEV